VETAELARRWRDAWVDAWPRRDVEAIAVLYGPDASYRSHPLRAADSPRAYLERVFAEEEAIECRFGDPLVAGERAAVEWWASWVESGEEITLAGTTVLRFGDDGLVTEHVDYWVEGPGRTAPFPGWAGLVS
jgi:nuclear transport factor 2 (NTF2) superfamily protein